MPSHLGGFTSKSNKCFNKLATQPQVLKLGLCSHCSNALLAKISLNPTQGFNSNHSNLTKRGWGGLLKCSHGSEMALEYNSISTPKWVRVWGINTPLSKTSRCSVRLRPVRPVPQTGQTGQFKLTSRWTPTGQTDRLDRSDRSQ